MSTYICVYIYRYLSLPWQILSVYTHIPMAARDCGTLHREQRGCSPGVQCLRFCIAAESTIYQYKTLLGPNCPAKTSCARTDDVAIACDRALHHGSPYSCSSSPCGLVPSFCCSLRLPSVVLLPVSLEGPTMA